MNKHWNQIDFESRERVASLRSEAAVRGLQRRTALGVGWRAVFGRATRERSTEPRTPLEVRHATPDR